MAASITASLNTADGVLRIEGTDAADRIHIRDGSHTIRVDGVSIAVTDGGVTTQTVAVPSHQISNIIVAALDGNDLVHKHDGLFTTLSSKPIVIHGGMGNDTLIGARGSDWIYGESGVDSILGGQGSDHIYGDANPVAAQFARDYSLFVQSSQEVLNGTTIKWLATKYDPNGTNDLYYITSTGELFHHETVTAGGSQILDSLVQVYDPSYFDNTRKLEIERGLYEYGLYTIGACEMKSGSKASVIRTRIASTSSPRPAR
jgi:Ca2+-binding RTX toxin-like protein